MELSKLFSRDSLSDYIVNTWDNYNSQRRGKLEEWKELRNYVFATDTSTTSNAVLPWKNSTTVPKLCQIRDNLHSNYLSALFPNDEWLRWVAYSQEDATKRKAKTIEAYMGNKTREGGFREVISQLIYDFIDYGNAFATADFLSDSIVDDNGVPTSGYIGPVARRISPLDIVFNPLAASFEESFKIVRSLVSPGELKELFDSSADYADFEEMWKERNRIIEGCSGYSADDFDKQEGFRVDGFGNYYEYLQSGYIELLTFYGDYHNQETGELQKGRIITVMDRMRVVRDVVIPSWLGRAPIYHVGWRLRPDNLWAMGPLDNLVGMQYRIDHLENLKADAMDLAVLPPLVIKGDVEEFEWHPGAEIHVDVDGDVAELGRNVQWVIQAENQIQILEQKMEMYAGAPREAMGIRTAGEKTAYEVQQLQNAAGRIFQEKISSFEINLLEKVLNAMLETSKRNLNRSDVVRVMDDDLGAQEFIEITKEDITASGVLRPIGARHFAAQAQLLQNLTGVFNSQIGNIILPHTSATKLASLVEDVLGLGRFELFRPNVAVFEQQETQRLLGQAQEDLEVEQTMPVMP